MGRKKSKGLPWFKHYTGMSGDDKLAFVRAEHGLEGFGTWNILLEKIYREGFFINWTQREATIFSTSIGLPIDRLNALVETCLSEGLFDRDVFESQKILTSEWIQEGYIDAKGKPSEKDIPPQFYLIGKKARKLGIDLGEIPKSGTKVPESGNRFENNADNKEEEKNRIEEEKRREEAPPSIPGIRQPQKASDEFDCLIEQWENIRAEKDGYRSQITRYEKQMFTQLHQKYRYLECSLAIQFCGIQGWRGTLEQLEERLKSGPHEGKPVMLRAKHIDSNRGISPGQAEQHDPSYHPTTSVDQIKKLFQGT